MSAGQRCIQVQIALVAGCLSIQPHSPFTARIRKGGAAIAHLYDFSGQSCHIATPHNSSCVRSHCFRRAAGVVSYHGRPACKGLYICSGEIIFSSRIDVYICHIIYSPSYPCAVSHGCLGANSATAGRTIPRALFHTPGAEACATQQNRSDPSGRTTRLPHRAPFWRLRRALHAHVF